MRENRHKRMEHLPFLLSIESTKPGDYATYKTTYTIIMNACISTYYFFYTNFGAHNFFRFCSMISNFFPIYIIDYNKYYLSWISFDHEKNVMEIKKIDLKGSGERSLIWKDCSGRRVALHKTLPASIPLSTSKETFPIDFRVFVVDGTSERRNQSF